MSIDSYRFLDFASLLASLYSGHIPQTASAALGGDVSRRTYATF